MTRFPRSCRSTRTALAGIPGFAALLAATVSLSTPALAAGGPIPGDCNGNGIPDDIEVIEGLALDADGNGVPDACEFGIQLHQVHWITPAGNPVEPFSDWGRVAFQFPPSLAEAYLFPSTEAGLQGWLNIELSIDGLPPQWQVRNHPVQALDPQDLQGRLPLMLPVDLGVPEGQPAFGGDVLISITPQPLPEPLGPEGSLILQQQPVAPLPVVYGGGRDDDLGVEGHTGIQGPWMIPAREHVVVDGEVVAILCPPFQISIPENQAPAVAEEGAGCAPGGVARSLAYLKQTCPDLNLPDDPQDIYDGLRNAMGSDVGENGKGTYLGPVTPDGSRGILGGKADYLEARGLTGTIVTTTSTNFADVAHCLADGADVEIFVDWGTRADGTAIGAHVAWVVRMQAVKDLDGNIIGWVAEIVDDLVQGDDDAENVKTPLVFAADGSLLGHGAGAELVTFIVEKKVDPAVPGDADGDGDVDFDDIIAILGAWGPCSGDCPADLDGDGNVGFTDLIETLSFFN